MNNFPVTENTAIPKMDQTLNTPLADLRDIHLPDPVSWWPIAPGWWLIIAAILLIVVILYVSRKIYLSRQLQREISSEIDIIKQQFQQTQNKSELVKALSVLLRRASITYYPTIDVAGLTGEDWLQLLDDSLKKRSNITSSSANTFQSKTGRLLITVPYQAETALTDFDEHDLIQLCEHWLLSSHRNPAARSHKDFSS